MLLLAAVLNVVRKHITRKLAQEIGGSKRFYSLSVAAAAAILAIPGMIALLVCANR